MSAGQTQFVARHVHELVERQRLDELSDPVLLDQFLSSHDEAAFAALVRRHGPMVLGTCRRVLRHSEDAEDASQATFLVLARKGGSVRGRHCLAGWLHRVAVRAAVRLRRQTARANAESLEHEPPSQPAGDELTWREVRNIFDREVLRLPERFRLPLILCCLEGRTRNEAAKMLNWSEGVVRGRLERGRKLLRSRFTRKGLALPAIAFATLLEQCTSGASLPPGLTSSASASKLADGILRSMALAKVKLAAWSMSAALLLGSVVGLGMYQPAMAQPKPGESPPPAAEPAKPLADAEKNLDTFVLRVSLAPQGEGKFDPKFSMYHVLLYVPNLRLEPPANGPDGKPIEAHARITEDQAKKIVAALKDNSFFGEQDVGMGPRALREKTNPHATIGVRYQAGEDPTQREITYPWRAEMLRVLDAIRASVDGDAAKAMDQLLSQLTTDREKWESSLATNLKKLQGNWIAIPKDIDLDGLRSPYTYKCNIEGTNITFKPKVQISPLLDVDTIKGTFELSNDKDRRLMTIVGSRHTISKVESGTWTLSYRVTDTTLTLLLPAVAKQLPADGKPRWDLGDREFVFKRVLTGVTSEWGEVSNGVSSRIRTAKQKYTNPEARNFELDLRDSSRIAGKAWYWQGVRVGHLAEIEVDGKWYRAPEMDFTSAVAGKLALGETVQGWTTVTVEDDFWKSTDGNKLSLVPGKHKIRVKYHLTSSDSGKPGADPISGTLEFEILPPEAKQPDKEVSSAYGEPSDGIISRIRAAKKQFRVEEQIELDLDVAGFGNQSRSWTGLIGGHFARVEVDGVWYVYKYQTREFPVRRKLVAGAEYRKWTTTWLSKDWIEENPLKYAEAKALVLWPGKHTIRVGFEFASDETKPPSAHPISGKLEIEIVAAPGSEPAVVWKESSLANPHGKSVPNALTFSPDGKLLASVGGSELVVMNMTGKTPKEYLRRKLDGGLEFRGFDSKGGLLFLRRWPRERFGSRTVSLTVLREDEIDRKDIPAIDVNTDVVDYVAISPDLLKLGIATHSWESVRVIDRVTQKEQRMDAPKTETKAYAIPMGLAFTPDGKTLFGFGSNDYPVKGKINGVIVAWDAATGAVRWFVEEGDGQRSSVLSADGKTLATVGHLSRDVVVRDAATGKKQREFPANGAFAVGLSPDGKTVVLGTHEYNTAPRKALLEVFDVEGKTRLISTPSAGTVGQIAFHPNGQSFVTADIAGNLKWWNRVPK